MPISKAKTIPSKWYYTKKIFKLENKMIFLKSWHLVGTESILKNPGDTLMKEISESCKKV